MPTRIVGLTGGIATGKSLVASLLRDLGATIIDADELAREAVQPGSDAWRRILAAFGPGILLTNQSIDRKKLRQIIFKNDEARKKLESITHPEIRKLAQERMAQCVARGDPLVVYVAPLLFENGIHLWLRPVIVVICDPTVQQQRLRERDKLAEDEIRRHLAAQMPLANKKQLADFVVENNGDMASLKGKVKELWQELESISPVPDTFPPKDPRGSGRPPG